MIDDKAAVELILKIQVPHMGIVKTLRTSMGVKVGTLTEHLVEKLETAEKQDFSNFGLYWYSETGPLWLSDNSYIRAYGLKTGDTLQYKQKQTIQAGPPAATNDRDSKKASSPFLSSARLRTISSPQMTLPSLPSLPSSPAMSHNAKSRREGHKSSTKETLMKAFQFGGDNKQAASQVPPPPSHPHQYRPISVSSPMVPTKSFHAPPSVIIPDSPNMQKSLSTPSPTITMHRLHSATAPPKPISPLSLSMQDEEDDNISPRQHSPLQHHAPAQLSPSSPLQPPPTLVRAPSLSNPPLPRMPSQLPPLYRAPSDNSVHATKQHACACEHNRTQSCAHRDELERVAAQSQKMTQRIELTECILTDTLQAIDDGEADLQAVKMYLKTALASLKREDVAQISFGK